MSKVYGAVTAQEKASIRERKEREAASKITFPFQPKAVFTKSGGTVIEIQGIEHKVDRPQMGHSRDYWYYLATIKWSDTGKTSEPGRHLYPYDMCTDTPEGHIEINALSEAMMDYLREHGTWKQDAAPRGWTATKRK
jgi:hypothetical protein